MEIYVGTKVKGSFQPVVLENRPLFCVGCKKRGHVHSDCGRNPDARNDVTRRWLKKVLSLGKIDGVLVKRRRSGDLRVSCFSYLIFSPLMGEI